MDKYKIIVNTGHMKDTDITKEKIQDIKNGNGPKPEGGLWGCSDKTNSWENWKYWCKRNQPDWYNDKSFEITLKEDARILVVDSWEKFRMLLEDKRFLEVDDAYDIEDVNRRYWRERRIDWEGASKNWDVIEFKYFKYDDLSEYMPGLDCDSSIILNRDAIEEIKTKQEIKDFTKALKVKGESATLNYDLLYEEQHDEYTDYGIEKSNDFNLTVHVNEEGQNTPYDIYTGKGIKNLILEGFEHNFAFVKINGNFETLAINGGPEIPRKINEEMKDVTLIDANFENFIMSNVPGKIVEIFSLKNTNNRDPQIKNISISGENFDKETFLKSYFPSNLNPTILNINGENINMSERTMNIEKGVR